ncbi:PAAR domain-containing protein [Acinetobacter sp. Marseille-Q1618]|uniref:PAAR domain-containing protein n=1 Tax=Acinetobacter sp. Marseille-Q1618 TaxID=2697502 RepID=UPI0020C3DC44|nr:PAAR domain-containing protein [Acinetobacter sp. Marseille-Q1618]
MKPIGIDGSTTSHGGVVSATQSTSGTNGKAWLRAGDGFTCPKCNTWSVLIQSNSFVNVHGKYVALVGDKFTCGATLEAMQSQSFVENNTNTSQINQINISNFLANPEHKYGQRFLLRDELTKEPLASICYEVITQQGVVHGHTDEFGYTELITSKFEEEVEIKILVEESNHGE